MWRNITPVTGTLGPPAPERISRKLKPGTHTRSKFWRQIPAQICFINWPTFIIIYLEIYLYITFKTLGSWILATLYQRTLLDWPEKVAGSLSEPTSLQITSSAFKTRSSAIDKLRWRLHVSPCHVRSQLAAPALWAPWPCGCGHSSCLIQNSWILRQLEHP